MPVPSFWQVIENRYKGKLTHQFLLYHNINDIIWDDIYAYLYTKDYLMERMNWLGCDAVLYYSRSEGIIFPNLGMRDAYQNALKLTRIEEIEPIPEPEEGKEPPPIRRINEGLRNVGQEKMVRDPHEAMLMLENFFRQGMGDLKVGLLINNVERLLPNRKMMPIPDQKIIDVETFQRWAVDLQMRLRGHIILLLTENISDVAPELLNGETFSTFPVRIPMPTYQERLTFIRHLLHIPEKDDEAGKYKLDLPEGMLSEEFAGLTHGLNLIDIQNLWITGKSRGTPVSPNMIVQQNRESIRSRSYGRLELIYGEHGLNIVGGLDNVISYMINIIQSMKNWETKSVPMGVLMVGPSGTGKTILMSALARDMGMHFVKLRDIRGSDPLTRGDWDLHRALEIIQSLIPVVVFIDDIDKVGHPLGDSYERRLIDQLRGDLVRLMGNSALRGKVLWVGASNRPDMIHPDFRKRGRLDDMIPFVLPNQAEREDILRKLFAKNAIPYDNNINFASVAGRTSLCTGADLEMMIMRSYQNARREERDAIIEQDLIKSADEFIQACDVDMYEYMMLLAIREASLSPLLPKPLEPTLQERAFEGGKLSKAKINQRLRELETKLNIQKAFLAKEDYMR